MELMLIVVDSWARSSRPSLHGLSESRTTLRLRVSSATFWPSNTLIFFRCTKELSHGSCDDCNDFILVKFILTTVHCGSHTIQAHEILIYSWLTYWGFKTFKCREEGCDSNTANREMFSFESGLGIRFDWIARFIRAGPHVPLCCCGPGRHAAGQTGTRQER